jgi:magnesium transporter
VTAIIASSVVSLFEETISQVVILATFMPVVAGMGGNSGTQTLTIVIRGLALGEIDKENVLPILRKEVFTGLINGLATGLAMAVLGVFWSGKLAFGIVIGVAMILNLVAATSAGFIVPVVLKKCKIDPALASSIFVTTVTDVLGFFFFLSLGTLFLPYLI